jgi:hypothetical protein
LPALSSVFASMVSPIMFWFFPIRIPRIIGSWKVIQLHGRNDKK